jgi:hypothetical protein
MTNEITPRAAPTGDPSLVLYDAQLMGALSKFAHSMSLAEVTVPKHLHGKPADCLAIVLQAMRWRMDPYVVASKTSVISGNLCYEAQLVVAVLKSSGAVHGRPHYEWRGEVPNLECRAGFVPAGETEVVWTEWLSFQSVKVKNSPLWQTNPKQQFGYLQARNWSRLYAPDAMLGVYTPEEMESGGIIHMGDAQEVAPPAGPRRKSDQQQAAETVEQATQAATQEQAQEAPAEAATQEQQPTAPLPTGDKVITSSQVTYLRQKLQGAPINEGTICRKYKVVGIEQLTPEQFDETKAYLLSL